MGNVLFFLKRWGARSAFFKIFNVKKEDNERLGKCSKLKEARKYDN